MHTNKHTTNSQKKKKILATKCPTIMHKKTITAMTCSNPKSDYEAHAKNFLENTTLKGKPGRVAHGAMV